jgi:membrane protease YdiL (CAAX protease family)
MTSAPPPHFEPPGPPPSRPELPEGLEPREPPAPQLPRWPIWAPFVALLIGVTFSFVGATLAYAVAYVTGWRGDQQTPAMTIVATIAQDVGFVVGVLGMAKLTYRRPTAADLGLRRVRLLQGLGALIAAYAVFQGISSIYAAFVHTSQKQDVLDQLGAGRSSAYLAVSCVVVCVLAPIAEELLFRGFFFTALRRTMPALAAAAVTGVIFGLVHVVGTPIALLVPLAVLGFALCVVYLRTGSLLPCMALHSVNNAIAFGVSLKWPLAGTVALVIGAPTLVTLLGLLAARSRALNPSAPAAA